MSEELTHNAVLNSNPKHAINSTCPVKLECDGYTASLSFPSLTQEGDNIGPTVYATVRGDRLHLVLCGVEESEHEFYWCEGRREWVKAKGEGALT